MSLDVLTQTDRPGALQRFCELAEAEPDGPFIVIDGEVCTRRDFLEGVAMGSGAMMRHGVSAGDHVALVMPNSISWYVRFWAAVNLGAVPIPLDPQIGAWELQNLTELLEIKLWAVVPRFRSSDIAGSIIAAASSGPPFIVTVHGGGPGLTPTPVFLDGASPAPVAARVPAPGETLMLACTSGTTGNPKIIVVPHRGFVRAQQDMAVVLGLSHDDSMLLGMPMYHQGGFGMGLQALLAGASIHYQTTFDPAAFLDTIEQRRITVVQLTATLAKILLSSPDIGRRDLSSLRLAYFAGEVLPDELAREFWERRGIRVVNVIGSSETGTMAMWDSAADSAHPPSDFLPLPFTRALVCDSEGVELAAGECGHLWVSTDALLREYLGNQRETAARLVTWQGRRWFDTQDLAMRLPGDRIRFVGRAKRVVKRGANLIHPEEIEVYLLTHPGIAAVAVVPEEHSLYGEAIVAHVQPAPGVTLERGELLAFCRGKIAAYKTPDKFIIVERLPADIGKVQYKHLRRPSGD